MQQSEQINELAEALAKAQGLMQNAKKDSHNPHFKSNYADLASVIDAIRLPFAENSLSYYQTTDFDSEGGVTLHTTVAHKSGQWIRSAYPVRPQQNTPQGFGSALTYARRYTLSAMAGVAAEDDDGNAGSGISNDSNDAGSPHRPTAAAAPAVTEFKQMVAQAHAMTGLNDFERKFVNEQHDRIKQYGDKVRLPTEKQMEILKRIVAKSESHVDYAKESKTIMEGPPPGHPASVIDDEIRY
jgi:hypothetical protein